MTQTKLAFVWQALLTDGTIINQFEDAEQTKEHLFREVLDRQDDLKLFTLINVKTQRIYRLDLELGRFHFMSLGFIINPEQDMVGGSSKNKYRLIYFRRVEKSFSYGGARKIDDFSSPIKFFLGYQYTDEEGKNVKHISQITENDEIYLV